MKYVHVTIRDAITQRYYLVGVFPLGSAFNFIPAEQGRSYIIELREPNISEETRSTLNALHAVPSNRVCDKCDSVNAMHHAVHGCWVKTPEEEKAYGKLIWETP